LSKEESNGKRVKDRKTENTGRGRSLRKGLKNCRKFPSERVADYWRQMKDQRCIINENKNRKKVHSWKIVVKCSRRASWE
jgi:hypothetical protein